MKPLEYWTPEGFEISSYKYSLKERINKTYKTSGSDNTGICTYTYNELGFRGDSVSKKGFRVMSIGCSITEGVGLNDNETWSHQFCRLINNGVDFNFGVSGRSNDFISRCLISYFDVINPDLVLVMYTYPHRREIYNTFGGIEPFIPGIEWGFLEEISEGKKIQKSREELQNDYEDFNNWYRNHLLITNYLENKKTKFVWNGVFLNNDYVDDNKFNGDYKNFIDYAVDNEHPGPKHNKVYAYNLYNHIKNNYNLDI